MHTPLSCSAHVEAARLLFTTDVPVTTLTLFTESRSALSVLCINTLIRQDMGLARLRCQTKRSFIEPDPELPTPRLPLSAALKALKWMLLTSLATTTTRDLRVRCIKTRLPSHLLLPVALPLLIFTTRISNHLSQITWINLHHSIPSSSCQTSVIKLLFWASTRQYRATSVRKHPIATIKIHQTNRYRHHHHHHHNQTHRQPRIRSLSL